MLSTFDDYPIHQTGGPLTETSSGDRNHYDRYFYNGYDRDGSIFFALAMGLYPNRSVQDASFSVVVDGVQRSVHAARRAPADRADLSCGPIRIEVVIPFDTHRLVVDDPDRGIHADLTFHARTVAVEEPRFVRRSGARLTMDYTRLTQFGGWTGTITVDGTEHQISPLVHLGSRDRSWGIRPVGEPEGGAPGTTAPQFFWLWAPLNFDDVCTHFDCNETATGERWHEAGFVVPVRGAGDPVLDTGGLDVSAEPMRRVDHDLAWRPGTRHPERAALTFEPWNSDASTISLEPIVTFQMLGIGYFHPEWAHGRWHGEEATGATELVLADLDPAAPQHTHVQVLVRASWGDRIGVGVLESLVIGDHQPTGLSGLFNGA